MLKIQMTKIIEYIKYEDFMCEKCCYALPCLNIRKSVLINYMELFTLTKRRKIEKRQSLTIIKSRKYYCVLHNKPHFNVVYCQGCEKK